MNNILITIFFSEEHFLLICNKQFQVVQVCTTHEDQILKKRNGLLWLLRRAERPVFASVTSAPPLLIPHARHLA